MIVVNGMEYSTLEQNLYVDDKKVLQAYCNGNLVYPDREDVHLLKVRGYVDRTISHDHTGENPSADASGGNYIYYGDGEYQEKGCFSLVIRSYTDSMRCSGTVTIPSAHVPLNGSWSSSYGDINKPGNAWVVFPYAGSTAPLIGDGGGIHPLLGSDEMEAIIIRHGRWWRHRISVELLLYVDVTAPRICPFSADSMVVDMGRWSYTFHNLEATPHEEYLDALPEDVNGYYWMNSYNRYTTDDYNWYMKKSPTGKQFYVSLSSGISDENDFFCSYLKVRTTSRGYSVPYTVCGTTSGAYREVETTINQAFNILNIPVTECLYSGSELTAPEEHLHPSKDDLEDFI